MALTAYGKSTINSLNMLAARYAVLAPQGEAEVSAHAASKSEQSEVNKLIGLAEQAAANVADPVGALADTIRLMANSEADRT